MTYKDVERTLRLDARLGVTLGDLVISSMKLMSDVGPANRDMDLSKVAGHGLSASFSILSNISSNTE